MIFESHAHYDDEQFAEDREKVMKKIVDRGVETVVNVAANLKGCEDSLALAREYPFVYAALGVHPDEVGELNGANFKWLEERLSEEKVVAVGEIGLDYYWNKEEKEIQKEWFIKQLELARRHQMPVIIHSRDAANDTLEIMKEQGMGLKGVIHCFSYSKEIALEYVEMGFYIGIGGVSTFKNAKKLKEVIEAIPLESILLETDAPYLAPVPKRGKRNHSGYLKYVAEEIANLKGISYQEVLDKTKENGKELFNI